MNLYETRTLVGDHLYEKDLLSCSLVSRAWRDSFQPCLWRYILIHPRNAPPLSRLVDSQGQIRQLHFRGTLQLAYASALTRCSQLKRLIISGDFGSPSPEVDEWELMQGVVKNSGQTLVALGLHLCQRTPSTSFWDSVAGCSNLVQLYLTEMTIRRGDREAFWKACEGLKVLHLSELNLVGWETDHSEQGLKRVQDLKMSFVRGLGPDQEIQFLEQCKALRSLQFSSGQNWVARDAPFDMDGFLKAFREERAWKDLDSFCLVSRTIQDHHLASLLEGAQVPWKRLQVNFTGFGPLAFRVLERRHFGSLENLMVDRCEAVTSEMGIRILTSCPKLKEVRLPLIQAKDILESGPWVCTEAVILTLTVGMPESLSMPAVKESAKVGEKKTMAKSAKTLLIQPQQQQQQRPEHVPVVETEERRKQFHHFLFKRISALGQLDRLELSSVRKADEPGLDMKVELGLDALVSMPRLKSVWLPEDQTLGVDDVRWMTSHWKSLEKVHGVPNVVDEGLNRQLKKLLLLRGVVVKGGM